MYPNLAHTGVCLAGPDGQMAWLALIVFLRPDATVSHIFFR